MYLLSRETMFDVGNFPLGSLESLVKKASNEDCSRNTVQH